ncbi:MAG: hypothetical protein GC164_13025 [Phycisphaera sp.]|nr:hypothetical protein [Phycisphaera sp.]
MPDAPRDEFYVGYLPVPTGYKRFLWVLLPVMLLVVVIGAVVIASQQSNPGDAVWHDDGSQRFIGGLIVDPYPMLVENFDDVADQSPPDTTPHVYLIVSEGKLGSRDRLAGLHGQRVRLAGTLLKRDGRAMIELTSTDNAIKAFGSSGKPLSSMQAITPVTLTGEVIDPKCYLGAMKPGGGVTHKACAELCLRGGIPPMLVARNDTGGEDYFLLTDENGGPVLDSVLPYLGEPVTIKGRVSAIGDLNILRIDKIERVP